MIKSPAEILNIEKACKLTDKAFNYILNKIREGVSEKELAFEIEFFIKKNGSDIAFPSIVAFGKNSAFPHHKPTDQQLMVNNQILIDIGAKINGYCSDMSRTVFFGKPTREQRKMYNAVLEAQKLAIDYLTQHCHSELVSESQAKTRSRNKFGMTGKSVDGIARDYIVSKGYPTIPHSLGHGIGLKVHEAPKLSPNSKDILKPDMVFTIEPGIYIKGFGGVRIEDVVVLGSDCLGLITKAPRELIIL